MKDWIDNSKSEQERLNKRFYDYLVRDDVVQMTSYSNDLLYRALELIPKRKLRRYLNEHKGRYESEEWFQREWD